MKFQSSLPSNLEHNKKIVLKPFLNSAKLSVVQNRSKSIEEIEIIDNSTLNKVNVSKTESRKRLLEESISDNSKKVKLSGISHLQLMQDVVALIDDLIDKVCEIASDNKANEEDITIISSDENEEVKTQKKIEYKDSSEPMVIELNDFNDNRENVQNSADLVIKEGVGNQVGRQIPEDENLKKSEVKLSPNEEGLVGRFSFKRFTFLFVNFSSLKLYFFIG